MAAGHKKSKMDTQYVISGTPFLLPVPFTCMCTCISLGLHSKYTNRNIDNATPYCCENIIAVSQDHVYYGDKWQGKHFWKKVWNFQQKVLIRIEKSLVTIFHSLYWKGQSLQLEIIP